MEEVIKIDDNISLVKYNRDNCSHVIALKTIMTDKEITDRTGQLLQNVALALDDDAFLIKIRDIIVGMIDFNEYQSSYYVSYAILEAERNKGYAAQVLRAIPFYIFSTYPNTKQILASIERDNLKSINSAIKAGYKICKDAKSKYIMYGFSNEKMLETTSKII